MEAVDKILTLRAVPWCEEAARYLEATLRGVPCFTVADYQIELERNPDCLLLRVTEDERTVGYVVMRLERYQGGCEGVILAAAGRLAGASLYGQVLPVLERMFRGVTSYRVDSSRSAGVLELMRAGYLPTHFVMRKAAPRAPAIAGDELLEQLAAANTETVGGPDLRSRPGRLHKGGGSSSSSSSTTTQTTNQVDRRQVVDGGSVGVSSDSSTVNISVLDQGAILRAGEIAAQAIHASSAANLMVEQASSRANFLVDQSNARLAAIAEGANFLVDKSNARIAAIAEGAFELVKASDQDTGKNLSNVLGFAKDVFVTGIGVLDKAGRQIDSQVALVAKAYDNAQGEGTQKNYIAAAALATVAIAAIAAWSKK